MIWPDNIPDEVVEAARGAWLRSDVSAKEDWRVAIAAALRAWPGFEYRADAAFPAFGYGPAAIILPLPQEDGDE